MADMTDSPFCAIVKEMASPIIFREMVSSEAIVRGNLKTLKMAEFDKTEHPIVQQIFGANPETMALASKIIMEKYSPDGIDINMGCPANKITGNFNGAALMKEPKLASTIVERVRGVIQVPVSVKIRTGWSDSAECLNFARVLEDAGADLITIHGRTKKQAYSGKSDWNTIREAREMVSIPVLANGDIFTPEDVARALEITNCAGVMIARGALGNPWIFSRIETMLKTGVIPPEPGMNERVEIIIKHLHKHIERYGERGIVTFRKHLCWYLRGVAGAKQIKQKLNGIVSAVELERELNKII
jgi:tRNA-dihydrouridine synthase B